MWWCQNTVITCSGRDSRDCMVGLVHASVFATLEQMSGTLTPDEARCHPMRVPTLDWQAAR